MSLTFFKYLTGVLTASVTSMEQPCGFPLAREAGAILVSVQVEAYSKLTVTLCVRCNAASHNLSYGSISSRSETLRA
jgi:hypothetical protein